jgi:hypothetical protein
VKYINSCGHHLDQFRKFSSPSSQHTQRSSKSVPIDAVDSGIRSILMGNDFHVSYVKIGPIVLEIQLVVDSAS